MSWGTRKRTVGLELYRTKRWQRLRTKVLRDHPLCVMSGKVETCRVAAVDVDHIKPHLGDKALFYAVENLQPMCRSCHSRKTAQELLGKGTAFDEKGMPLDPDHHWNRED